MRFRESWHQWIFRLLSFGLVDWANSHRMLQMEIRHPLRYRLLTWPPLIVVVAVYFFFALWLGGVI